MPRLEVFDPPMCCSTGVCGPNVDPVLPRFAADLDWVRAQGVDVQRHNLAQQAGDFLANALVKQTLTEQGQGCLPLILFDGRIVARGSTRPGRCWPRYWAVKAEPQATGRVLPVRPSGGKCC